MHSSKLLQDLESWTKLLCSMQRLLAFTVKIMSCADKSDLFVSRFIEVDIENHFFVDFDLG